MQNQNRSALTLEQLNDDCLEHIFRCLGELPAQVHAASVNKRFYHIITRIWRKEYKTLWLDEWRDILPQHELLGLFLHSIRIAVTKVKIIDECVSAFLKDLDDLEIRTLPKVTRFELYDYTDCFPNDADIRAITKLTPNLTYLFLPAPITGRYLVNFTMLEELHLYDAENKKYEIDQLALEEICAQLKNLRVLDIRAYESSCLKLTNVSQCLRLQVLKCNLSTLKSALHDVLNLPQLRVLTVLLDQVLDMLRIFNVDTYDYKIYETVEFYEILTSCATRITSMSMDNRYMPLDPKWHDNQMVLKLTKLQKFAFSCCEFESAPLTRMLEPFLKMTQLRILSLSCCANLTNENVLQFIRNCKQLTDLDVRYCSGITKDLLHEALKILGPQKDRRPLLIYYALSGLDVEIDRENYKFWNNEQKILRFSSWSPPYCDGGLSLVNRGFEFEFEKALDEGTQ